MLILNNSRFFCCPKTGSQFCTQAISSCCVVYEHPEEYHAGVSAKSGNHLPTFGFVRHPVSWYESYWRYRMGSGWLDDGHQVDRDCKADNLEMFIENVLNQYPGWMSRGFEYWMGPNLDYFAFVGKYESLLDDLCSALNFFGEPYDEVKLRNTPAINVGDRARFPSSPLNNSIVKRIEESERRIIEKFYSANLKN